VAGALFTIMCAAWLGLARTLGISPPGENGFEFGELEETINFSKSISRGNLKKGNVTQGFLRALELPITPTASKW
jgi:hypothetical protein